MTQKVATHSQGLFPSLLARVASKSEKFIYNEKNDKSQEKTGDLKKCQ